MSNFLTKFNSKITDPLGIINKVGDKWGMQKVTDLYRQGPIGNAGGIKAAAGSKFGSLMSGRAILQGGAKEQNMENARTFDVFGSPATAGGKQQTTARLGAILYGLGAAAAAYGGGAAGSTSASAAPSASPAGGYGATQMGYAGNTVGTGAPASGGTTAASSPAWLDYARMGNSMMQQGQPQQTQQGALQHQYVGGSGFRNPYLMGYPWS